MVFSDSTNKSGIVEDIDFWVNTDEDSYDVKEKTRNINRWYEKVIGWILEAGSPRLQFDDSRYTTYPYATADIEDGVSVIPFDETWLAVQRVDLLTSAGWVQLTPFDHSDVQGGYDAFENVSGTPQYYDIQAGTLVLKPTPNYDRTDGIKVWFTRKGSLFSTTDTDEPGFAPQFHRILSLGAAYDYAISRQLPQASSLRQEIEQLHQELNEFYGWQDQERMQITPKRYGYNPAK